MDVRQVMMGAAGQAPTPTQGQNLVNPLKVDVSSGASRQPGFWWLIALSVLGVFAALSFSYAYFRYLSSGLPLWFAAVALLCFIALSILQALLEKNGFHRLRWLLLEMLALFAPPIILYFKPSFASSPAVGWQLLIPASVIALIFLALGYFESRSELRYGTEIRFFRVTRPVAGKIVTVALFFMIAWYALGGGGNFFLGEASFDRFFSFSSALAEGFYPSISVSGSFHDFAVSVVTEQAGTEPAFTSLTPAEQDDTIAQNATVFTQNFSKALGVAITPSSTVSDVTYDFITDSLHDWHERFGVWFIIAWALALFVVLRSVAIFFVWLAQLLAMLLYEFMLAAGIVHIIARPETREAIEFR